MNQFDNSHITYADYQPLPEDEAGLTPHQIRERRVSTRRVSRLRYDTEMTTSLARRVIDMDLSDLAATLELDREQAFDVRTLAEQHLERLVRHRQDVLGKE